MSKTVLFSLILATITICIYFNKPLKVYAHPGNTASDGCHYCRTNCDDWGVEWNERHCHNGSESDYEEDSYIEEDNNSTDYTWLILGGLGTAGYIGYSVGQNKKE